ncbi:MAG: UDP-N-acetylmuramoyl-L-alanine--D-glutamate ligase [Chlamydiae bacterium]|nr:UDP-N-acetylmuramoyl-L-alanine--D-glutamate ligase [Chlamydiota bacterium]
MERGEKRALIIGLGVSGKATAVFLLDRGYQVVGVDDRLEEFEKNREFLSLLQKGLLIRQERDLSTVKEFSLIVPSPGIPLTHPLIVQGKESGVKIIGEIELACEGCSPKAIAVTGTNGKTTVTLLVEHVLNAVGKQAKALGNIGTPLTQYLLKERDSNEILVIELSSYQLEVMERPLFDAGVILNITPDHLDRYKTLQEYARAKSRLSLCIRPEGKLFLFREVAKEYHDFFRSSFQVFGDEESLSQFSFLEVKHDRMNAEAAWLLCAEMGVSKESFLQALKTFKKPSHRMEFIREIKGVSYYDDSKGTNIDAVMKAVQGMKGSVVLIAGGVDKGASYLPWKEGFEGKVKKLVLLGESAQKIQRELGLFFNVEIVDSLESAVKAASSAAACGDAVLLSPGCSSFDMFRDYAHRGNEFQRVVGLLAERSTES